MGYELAKAAIRRGYRVTLISGPTNLAAPKGVRLIETEDALDMCKAVGQNFKNADCLFMASAVSDWRPEKVAHRKIKRTSRKTLIKLVENPDILAKMGRKKDGKLLIGFALESGSLVKNATKKLREKNLDLIVANKVGERRPPFGTGKTDVTIIDRSGRQKSITNTTKKRLASALLDKAEKIWERRR